MNNCQNDINLYLVRESTVTNLSLVEKKEGREGERTSTKGKRDFYDSVQEPKLMTKI